MNDKKRLTREMRKDLQFLVSAHPELVEAGYIVPLESDSDPCLSLADLYAMIAEAFNDDDNIADQDLPIFVKYGDKMYPIIEGIYNEIGRFYLKLGDPIQDNDKNPEETHDNLQSNPQNKIDAKLSEAVDAVLFILKERVFINLDEPLSPYNVLKVAQAHFGTTNPRIIRLEKAIREKLML